MKTTIEISDHLLNRAKKVSRQQNITLRSLMEEGLTRVLADSDDLSQVKIKPVTFKGRGLTPEFRGAGWTQLRDAAYQGHGS